MSHLASVRMHSVAAAVTDYQKVARYCGGRMCSSEVPVSAQRSRGLVAAVTDSAGLTQWVAAASRLALMPAKRQRPKAKLDMKSE